MKWRGILVAVACAVGMGGCGCGRQDISGVPDAADDAPEEIVIDAEADPVPDPASDPDLDPEVVDDAAEVEEPATTEGCGNAIVEDDEACDDGDLDDCNGCSEACEFERAMLFEIPGSGALIDSADGECGGPYMLNTLTVEAWFKAEPSLESFYLILQEKGIIVGIHNYFDSYTLSWGFYFNETEAYRTTFMSPSIPPDSWHHIAVTRELPEGSDHWEIMTYIDGVFYGSHRSAPSDVSWYCGGPLHLGRSWDTTGGDMIVDDIRISDAVIYTSAGFTPESRLVPGPETVALWRFNDDSGGIIADASGNGHDAVLVNGRLVPDDCHLP
jgi:cysteine-rich repeat protein